MKKIKYLVIFLFLLILFPNKTDAKVSDKQTENYANIVVFAYFNGEDEEVDRNYLIDNGNKIIDLYNGTNGRSVTNYLKSISYGKFNIQNIFPQYDGTKIEPLKLECDKNEAYNSNIDACIISNIIKKINIEDKVIDYNQDGFIDNLTIIIKGGDKETGSNTTFVNHKSDYFSNDIWLNKKIGTYNILNTYTLIGSFVSSGSGVIVHEFLHSLGYPDLYRNNSSDYPVHIWDIMASANYYMPYPLAYLRHKFTNWIDIDTITSNGTYKLDNQNNPNGNQAYIIKSPLNDYELFVVEFRKKPDFDINDNDSLDRGIGGSGLIVYRINTTVTGLSNVFGGTGVYVFRPNNPNNSEIINLNNAYLSAESGRTEIGNENIDDDYNALTFSDGTNSGIKISNVSSSSGDSMTFDVVIPSTQNLDLWVSTDYNDKLANNANKSIDIIEYDNSIIAASVLNKKILINKYDGNNWTNLNELNLENDSTSIKLIKNNNDLYLIYSGWGFINIAKYSSNNWAIISKIDNTNGEFSVNVINNQIYLTKIDENSLNATLLLINDDNVQELGIYYSGSASFGSELGYAGQPNIVNINSQIYLTIRNSAGNKIKLYKYIDKNNFQEIDNDMSSNTYSVIALNNKIYFSLGTNNGENLKLYIYDGKNFSLIDSNISYGFPTIVSSKGNIYVIASSLDESGNTKLYRIDENTLEFIKEGTDVDGASFSGKYSLTSINNDLYVALQRITDNNIIIKKKETISKLLSLTITPPIKSTYKVGDLLDTNGLKVFANYTNGSKEIINYQIEGFNSSIPGIYSATISYEGVKNTFSYEIINDSSAVIPLESIKFNKENLQLNIGDIDYLNVIYNPSNATVQKNINWKSSDENILTVTDGKIIAKGEGIAYIIASIDDLSIKTSVTVKKYNIKNSLVRLDVDTYIYTGEKIYPNVSVMYNNQYLIKNKDYEVVYENNKDVGLGDIYIKGINNFNDVIKINFKIVENKIEEKKDNLKLSDYIYACKYKLISEYIYGFKLGEIINEIKKKLNNSLINIETKSDIITTGTIFSYNNEKYISVIYGDINGDGKINSADLLKMRQHLLGTISLTGPYKKAASIVNGNTINSADLLRLRQHLLGIKEIKQ